MNFDYIYKRPNHFNKYLFASVYNFSKKIEGPWCFEKTLILEQETIFPL